MVLNVHGSTHIVHNSVKIVHGFLQTLIVIPPLKYYESVKRFKARLVARGFSRVEGIYYNNVTPP